MKLKFLILFLFANTLIFGQTPPAYPVHDFSINDGSTNGYMFMTHQPTNPLDPTFPALLMFDAAQGHLVYYRPFEPDINGDQSATTDFKLLPNGKMAFFRVLPGQGANAFNYGKYYMMDGSFAVVDSIGCDGYGTDGHEVQMTPGGNYLLLCTKDVQMDLSQVMINGSYGYANSTVRGQAIQELNPAGNEVDFWDPFVENTVADMYDDQWAAAYTSANPLLDWTHCNAIEYDGTNKLMLSSRHFNQIMKIDMAGDTVMWRLGGKRDDYGITDTVFTGQHDIRRLSNGNISIYNNAQFAGTRSGRSMEFALNESAHTATIVDEYIYDEDMFSLAMGSHRKLPNGKTLVGYGANFKPGPNPTILPRFVVVDNNDNLSMEFYFNDPLAFCYRTQHAPSLPFTLNRPNISVSNVWGGRKRLDAGVATGYLWNTGQTTRRIVVQAGSSAEDYFCYLPIGDGGYISSEIVTLGGSNKQAGSTVEALEGGFLVDVYPNPTAGLLNLKVSGSEGGQSYRILDVQGKTMQSGSIHGSGQVDLSSLAAGLFILEVTDLENGAQHRQRIVKN